MIKENIGLFNDAFPPVMDGVSVCVKNYAYWLQKKAGGVCVITPKNFGVTYDADYEVLDYFSLPVPFRHPYVTGIAEVDPMFMDQILRRRFKIVHAHCPFTSGLAAARIAKTQGIPMVATFHSKYRDDFSRVIPSKSAVDMIIRQIIAFYERADEVWVPQASVGEVLREYGYKGKFEVVENGCDLCSDYPDSFFTDARRSLGIGEGEFVMLFVGQHIWEKNTRLIIEALDLVGDLPFRMFFVGTGYAYGDMVQMVSERGLDSHVTFTGPVTDRSALVNYYAAADLFLFPSLYDNAPLVVREAAALHTPSVMTAGATASAIIDDGTNGFLIDGSAEDFARRLRELMASPKKVRCAGDRASVSIVRSWEDICEEVLDRYNSLIVRTGMICRA